MASTIDSADPGNTYNTANWDFLRLYDRTVLAYTPTAGPAGLALKGDLATGLGSHNADMTQWAYTITPNATFSDGTPIITADIKYAIERASWGTGLGQGPTYFKTLIQNSNGYTGPYSGNSAATAGVSGIQTPSATTIVFNLTQPFADFNYLMTLPETAPVEPSSDKGANEGAAYQQHMVTSGQYAISSYSVGKQMVLLPNAKFVAASDPNGLHKVHASKIVVNYGLGQVAVDQNLLSGQAQMDLSGSGVDVTAQGQILGDPVFKADADSVPDGFQTYLAINTTLSPLTDLACRQSIEEAIDKETVVSAAGGNIGGGAVATNILPPDSTGYVQSDLYPTPGNQGNPVQAKSLFTQCKSDIGSSFNPAFDIATVEASQDPKAEQIAETVQRDLDEVGFNVSIVQYASNTMTDGNAPGAPATADAGRIGLTVVSRDADFPTGYGYMENILTSAGIHTAGGSTNLSFWTSADFDSDLLSGLSASSPTASAADYAAADAVAMKQAVIVPLFNQNVLMYRPATDTNVTVSLAYGMYDYSILGASAPASGSK